MSISATHPRRILIVMEGMQSAIALMRALEYQKLFDEHPDYHVDFAFRTPEVLCGQPNRWYARFLRRVVIGPIYRRVIRRRERKIARSTKNYDLIYLVGVPSVRLHRELHKQAGGPVLVDLIDALWLPYHRQFGWQELEEMLAMSDAVICENQYTADFARKHQQQVFVVPNSPQLDVFDRWRNQVHRDPERVVLGWVGSADTSSSLHAIWEPLEELFSRYSNLHLRIVGGASHRLPAFEKVRCSVLPTYSQEEMVREILAMDIGMFPLFNVEDSFTRGASKTRIYMSGEVATICQNLGASQELIQDGINGMLANSSEEWITKLDFLVKNKDERKEIASRGLETMQNNYSKQTCFEQLTKVFETALEWRD
jgi:glycosyltransferase involved in cell wall biosynthesis